MSGMYRIQSDGTLPGDLGEAKVSPYGPMRRDLGRSAAGFVGDVTVELGTVEPLSDAGSTEGVPGVVADELPVDSFSKPVRKSLMNFKSKFL